MFRYVLVDVSSVIPSESARRKGIACAVGIRMTFKSSLFSYCAISRVLIEATEPDAPTITVLRCDALTRSSLDLTEMEDPSSFTEPVL